MNKILREHYPAAQLPDDLRPRLRWLRVSDLIEAP